jgi:hypothetical protein
MNTTTCNGGDHDGYTCVNEVAYTDCSQARTSTMEQPHAGQPDVADPLDNPTSTDLRGPFLVLMCHTMAGVGSTSTANGGAAVACEGGFLDSLGCALTSDGGWCATGHEGPVTSGAIRPSGAIDVAAEMPAVEILEDTYLAVTPVVLEEPVMVQGVIYNQSGSTVNDNATSQAALCGLLGGKPIVTTSRTGGSGLVWADVSCQGGLLDGMYCTNQTTAPSNCFWARTTLPESPLVTPMQVQEQPADLAPSPTAPVTPTEPATALTPTAPAEPTAPPAEPTAPPTVVFPTVPGGNDVPPGEGNEQPRDPTPTPHVIT